MTKAETKKKQTKEQREANDYRRAMVDDSAIIHLQTGASYCPTERQFFNMRWTPTLHCYDYLRELMDCEPDKFKGCQIVKQNIENNGETEE